MRVKSAFKGFFNHRLMANSCLGIVMLFCVTVVSASELDSTKPSDRELRAKQTNLLIRMIGHRLLLQSGDFTSRVMPVTETKEGTFLLEFENQFIFNHDSLIMMSEELFPISQFPSGYTVTVLDCMRAAIVYGFQVSHSSPDLLACRGRSESAGCYIIEFAFPDFYENVGESKAEINRPMEGVKSFRVDPQFAIPRPEELKTGNDIDKLTAELKLFKPREANLKSEELKTATSDFSLVTLVPSGMLLLLGVTLLVGRFGKVLTPAPTQSQEQVIVKKPVLDLPGLGKFLFDVKGQRLLSGSEVITLTDKECKVLELLNKSFGELIPRETLMQKIWINEGVITGRSLDMFVSKLRKKLSSDPELRITNVHGKGYKLEIVASELL